MQKEEENIETENDSKKFDWPKADRKRMYSETSSDLTSSYNDNDSCILRRYSCELCDEYSNRLSHIKPTIYGYVKREEDLKDKSCIENTESIKDESNDEEKSEDLEDSIVVQHASIMEIEEEFQDQLISPDTITSAVQSSEEVIVSTPEEQLNIEIEKRYDTSAVQSSEKVIVSPSTEQSNIEIEKKCDTQPISAAITREKNVSMNTFNAAEKLFQDNFFLVLKSEMNLFERNFQNVICETIRKDRKEYIKLKNDEELLTSIKDLWDVKEDKEEKVEKNMEDKIKDGQPKESLLTSTSKKSNEELIFDNSITEIKKKINQYQNQSVSKAELELFEENVKKSLLKQIAENRKKFMSFQNEEELLMSIKCLWDMKKKREEVEKNMENEVKGHSNIDEIKSKNRRLLLENLDLKKLKTEFEISYKETFRDRYKEHRRKCRIEINRLQNDEKLLMSIKYLWDPEDMEEKIEKNMENKVEENQPKYSLLTPILERSSESNTITETDEEFQDESMSFITDVSMETSEELVMSTPIEDLSDSEERSDSQSKSSAEIPHVETASIKLFKNPEEELKFRRAEKMLYSMFYKSVLKSVKEYIEKEDKKNIENEMEDQLISSATMRSGEEVITPIAATEQSNAKVDEKLQERYWSILGPAIATRSALSIMAESKILKKDEFEDEDRSRFSIQPVKESITPLPMKQSQIEIIGKQKFEAFKAAVLADIKANIEAKKTIKDQPSCSNTNTEAVVNCEELNKSAPIKNQFNLEREKNSSFSSEDPFMSEIDEEESTESIDIIRDIVKELQVLIEREFNQIYDNTESEEKSSLHESSFSTEYKESIHMTQLSNIKIIDNLVETLHYFVKREYQERKKKATVSTKDQSDIEVETPFENQLIPFSAPAPFTDRHCKISPELKKLFEKIKQYTSEIDKSALLSTSLDKKTFNKESTSSKNQMNVQDEHNTSVNSISSAHEELNNDKASLKERFADIMYEYLKILINFTDIERDRQRTKKSSSTTKDQMNTVIEGNAENGVSERNEESKVSMSIKNKPNVEIEKKSKSQCLPSVSSSVTENNENSSSTIENLNEIPKKVSAKQSISSTASPDENTFTRNIHQRLSFTKYLSKMKLFFLSYKLHIHILFILLAVIFPFMLIVLLQNNYKHSIDFKDTAVELKKHVYGQEAAINDLTDHLLLDTPHSKVILLVGGRGVGKSYTIDIIKRNYLKKYEIHEYFAPNINIEHNPSYSDPTLIIMEDLIFDRDWSNMVEFIKKHFVNENNFMTLILAVTLDVTNENPNFYIEDLVDIHSETSLMAAMLSDLKNISIKIIPYMFLDENSLEICIKDVKKDKITILPVNVDDIIKKLQQNGLGCKGAYEEIEKCVGKEKDLRRIFEIYKKGGRAAGDELKKALYASCP